MVTFFVGGGVHPRESAREQGYFRIFGIFSVENRPPGFVIQKRASFLT